MPAPIAAPFEGARERLVLFAESTTGQVLWSISWTFLLVLFVMLAVARWQVADGRAAASPGTIEPMTQARHPAAESPRGQAAGTPPGGPQP